MIRTLIALAALAMPVAAQDIRPADAERLARLDAHLGSALRQALADGPADAIAATQAALQGRSGPLAPEGDWACRTIKLGGLTPAVAYRPFQCRIDLIEPGRWRLVKQTGSQRLKGTLTIGPNGAVYTGVGHVGDAPATDYAGLSPDSQRPIEPNQTHAQVGLFEQVSDRSARLLMPAPILESGFDILHLTR